MEKVAFLLLGILTILSAKSQIVNKEDSFANGIIARNTATVISGYGSIKYKYEQRTNVARAKIG